mmetsp:Transcript_5073/g.8647  ORF Transcript_5073/g.8647 Transcript_5073/m.8647 type:complete len:116 (+) Transcript_5073:1-348(+)
MKAVLLALLALAPSQALRFIASAPDAPESHAISTTLQSIQESERDLHMKMETPVKEEKTVSYGAQNFGKLYEQERDADEKMTQDSIKEAKNDLAQIEREAQEAEAKRKADQLRQA